MPVVIALDLAPLPVTAFETRAILSLFIDSDIITTVFQCGGLYNVRPVRAVSRSAIRNQPAPTKAKQ